MSFLAKVIIGVAMSIIVITAVVVVVNVTVNETPKVETLSADDEARILDEATSIDKFKTDPSVTDKSFKPY